LKLRTREDDAFKTLISDLGTISNMKLLKLRSQRREKEGLKEEIVVDIKTPGEN
jgi:hypothetical protein